MPGSRRRGRLNCHQVQQAMARHVDRRRPWQTSLTWGVHGGSFNHWRIPQATPDRGRGGAARTKRFRA